ncbi:pam17p [Lichtheimia corymbifera JMRC:FSU:9682]|uniref:Presequence translocated-associated motor subunit PAM17 n=1 Tax=Lichtheimia corymbifera JMRC:FSU:9682 TaxID=1263082 RepID=A0A068RRQ7_9FUNG|nr:pam17p [Lichtheimia corymbifera JMRC:FSU:9682]
MLCIAPLRIAHQGAFMRTPAISRTCTYTTQNTPPSNSSESLVPTWDDYFKLRAKRRKYEIASYLPCTLVPVAGTGSYFMTMQIDPLSTIMGMDPIMAACLATVGAGFCGYLAGPVFGDALFKVMNQKYVRAMDTRDKDFYDHIKRNRSSARLNSIRNPVPDYYGEKINSVSDYRSWLRKQREHYRKGVFGGNMEETQ